MQSCLCLMTCQQRDANYQTVQKQKLGKIIQSLISTDETASIVKDTEHIVKVQDFFSVLERYAITKSVHLLKSLSQTMIFFTESNLRMMAV